MSPCGLDRNVPLDWDLQPEGDAVEEDSDEQSRTGASRSNGQSEEGRFKADGCGGSAGIELSAGKKSVAVLSGERPRGPEAWSCRKDLQSPQAVEAAPPSTESDQEEIFWSARRALWTNFSGRASGRGRWCGGGSRNTTAVDVGGRSVESGAQTPGSSPT